MNASMHKFLSARAEAFDERGTAYMVPTIQEMLLMEINDSNDLQEFADECLAERNRHATFNLKFMYYWSVHTYIIDLIECYKREYENS